MKRPAQLQESLATFLGIARLCDNASEAELKELQRADEAARDHRTDVVLEFKPDRERNGVKD